MAAVLWAGHALARALLSRGSGANLHRMKKQQALDECFDNAPGALQLGDGLCTVRGRPWG
jgi:hypothetical protein